MLASKAKTACFWVLSATVAPILLDEGKNGESASTCCTSVSSVIGLPAASRA